MKLYQRVKVINNTYFENGIKKGAIGYIIEQYDDKYEIEFSNQDGSTYAIQVMDEKDIVPFEESLPALVDNNQILKKQSHIKEAEHEKN